MQDPKALEAVDSGNAGLLIFKPELLALFGGVVSTLWDWTQTQIPAALELGPPGKRSATVAWYRKRSFAMDR